MDPDWSTLPDVCLLLIFQKLPLALLFGTLNLVCQKWNRLVQVCLRNHTELVLMSDSTELAVDIKKLHKEANPIGSELLANALRNANVADSAWAREIVSRNSIEFNLIRVPGASDADAWTDRITISQLNKLDRLTHLTVVLNWFRNGNSAFTLLGALARLIDHNANTLVSLKLDLNYPFYIAGTVVLSNVRELLNSLNRLTQLDHLTLNFEFQLADLEPREFAFLSRVRNFASQRFGIGLHTKARMLAYLVEHATAGRCNEIDIDLELSSNDVKALNPQLANKFRRICIVFPDDTFENIRRDLRQFGDRFVSLTSLEIHLSYMSFPEISKCLSRLTALIHLNLFVRSQAPTLAENDDDEQLEITPLPSVRYLRLDFELPTHSDFTKLHLSEVFPNVQVLRNETYLNRCAECNTDSDDLDWSIIRAKTVICTSLIQKTFFRLIPSLRVVHYDPQVPEILKDGLQIGLFTDGGRSSPPAYAHVVRENRN